MTDLASESDARTYGHFIEGAYVSRENLIDRQAPGTGAVVARYADGTAEDVDLAVAAARRAFDDGRWSATTGMHKAKILNEIAARIDVEAELLAALDAQEVGKPIRLARGDIAGAADLFRYCASLAIHMHGQTFTNHGPDFTGLVLREPAGVAGLITPWNFPALILSQKLPFALAAGCTVVAKPSEMTSSSSLEIARICFEAGVPAGVVNVVTGGGIAGQALSEHSGVDVLSFTGSTATGRRVIDASKGNLKKLSLELGGKAANIVFADANLEDAAEGVAFGVFFNNGECCVSQARLLVQDSIADAFIAEVQRRAVQVRLGAPLDDASDVGAMISEQHMKQVLGHVQGAVAAGAALIAGGRRSTAGGLVDGWFVEPTVLDRVTPEMGAFRDEIFGPVLTITRFSTAEEAIALANSVEYGLSNTIWSQDINKVLDVAKALKSGSVYVNTTIDAPPSMPFGGYKASGVGREMGVAGFEEFTELKSVAIRTGIRSGTFAFGEAR